MTNPTERFSNRVDSYVRARPSYPPEALDLLAARCELAPRAVVADIGSGTGILTRLLLTHGTDYASVNHRRISADALQAFFGAAPLQQAPFRYQQSLDLAGLQARLVSSSYTPAPDQPGHAAMLEALKRIYNEYQVDGQVHLDYDTLVFYGQLL